MLKSLNIENIAIIEKCNIEFDSGFNVLTGETGAGKSIIIDAINAVTGQRTSKELIRSGCSKATVTALFDDVDISVKELLSEYGVSFDDDTLIITRVINADGKNVCKINGVSVNVSVLKEIGFKLVNIHGQHDNQALLNPENHCGFIDSFGNYNDKISVYKDCYSRLKDVKKKLKSLKTDENEKQRRTELLKFQINEIEAANVTVGELDELIKRREIIKNSEKLKVALQGCYDLLAGDDENSGSITLAAQAFNLFGPISSVLPNGTKVSEKMTELSSELDDIAMQIREYCDSVSFDVGELDKCEQRIDVLNSLVRKYGGSEEKILEYLQSAKTEIENIINCDTLVLELEEKSDALEDELIEKAAVLTECRKQTAKQFSEKICDVLKYLEMPKVTFMADFQEGIYTLNGCDNVEFLISANIGQESKPLSKIASGGELSRIMLAIKSVMSNINDAKTLIFDEIDTGISGKAADKVGRQMKSLSETYQVICVTHLAQIASAADSHLLISKSVSNGNTFTDVVNVVGDERVNEIARIMSGTDITDNLFVSAKEMIDSHK